jgi:hypothetical protein
MRIANLLVIAGLAVTAFSAQQVRSEPIFSIQGNGINAAPDYSAQREALQKKLGHGIFVASYYGMEHEGRIVTWAVWSDGVRTALPKAEYVMVQNEDFSKRYVVSWNDFRASVTSLQEMRGISPARFLTPERVPAEYMKALQTAYVPPVGFPNLK